MKTDKVIQAALNGAIPDAMPGEYLLMGNWNCEPVEPGGITGCIVVVNATQPELKWRVQYSIKDWITEICWVSPACYLLGTANGEIIRVRNDLRDIFQTGTGRAIGSIWSKSDEDFWFSHRRGLSHWQGGKIIKSVGDGWFHAIHGLRQDFAVAVGAAGKVMRFDGKDWREIDSVPTNKELVSAFCVSDKEIYIGGWDGVLFRWDGTDGWTHIEIIGDDGGVVTDDGAYTIVQYFGEMYVGVGYCGLYKIAGNKAKKYEAFILARQTLFMGNFSLRGWIPSLNSMAKLGEQSRLNFHKI